jgi:hypothetical protein
MILTGDLPSAGGTVYKTSTSSCIPAIIVHVIPSPRYSKPRGACPVTLTSSSALLVAAVSLPPCVPSPIPTALGTFAACPQLALPTSRRALRLSLGRRSARGAYGVPYGGPRAYLQDL